jgi:hypothetical protein
MASIREASRSRSKLQLCVRIPEGEAAVGRDRQDVNEAEERLASHQRCLFESAHEIALRGFSD